ncbi:hypothetical protein [Streptomyces sp. Y7]|uniref:hypothetical protein n=1 Tax=Streptomyces sp. Y7 TaxID=3342392 RepID=UPI0037233938
MSDKTTGGDAPAGQTPISPREDLSQLSVDALLSLESDLIAAPYKEGADERALRLSVDERLVELLRVEGFAGPRYERFTQGLTDYALATMIKWNVTGMIFVKSRKMRREVPPDKVTLDWDYEECRDVAVDSVLNGHDLFREHGLVKGRWRPSGGACPTTYFVGAAVLSFRPVYLRWYEARESMRSALKEAARAEGAQQWLSCIPDQRSTDPFDAADLWDLISRLEITDPQTRGGLYYYAQGFTQREAAQQVGLSTRALEGRLRRLRDRMDQRQDDVDDDAGE